VLRLQVTCPAIGVGSNVRVSIEVAGLSAVGSEFRVSFREPVVSSLQGGSGLGPTTGAARVTVVGTNFGTRQYGNCALVDETPALAYSLPVPCSAPVPKCRPCGSSVQLRFGNVH
jgi:hypothetical protein